MTTADPDLTPLLKVGTPDLYAHNAFRLTGLMVTASMREVARYGDRLKLLQQVGGQAAAGLPAMLGSTHVPGPDELRTALRNLMDLPTRALHEFFWLWPNSWEQPEGDAAFMSLRQMDLETAKAIWTAREADGQCCISTHNLAVLSHMRALDLSLRDLKKPLPSEALNEMYAEWRMAMKRWRRIAEDEDLWDHYKARITHMDDPSVTTGLARRLRGDLHWAFDRILAMLAVAYAQKKRRIECQWLISFLKASLGGFGEAFQRATDHALARVRERLDHALQKARQQVQTAEIEGIASARLLLDAATPLLKVMELVQPGQMGSPEREKISRGALSIAVTGYNLIYCSKNPSPAVLAQREKRRHAEEYLPIMATCRALTTDAELHGIIDSNVRIAQALLQKMPPEINFEYSRPKLVNGRKRLHPAQRPRWSTLFLHWARLVPRSVWILMVIISTTAVISQMVRSISSRPIATGKFTSAELKAQGLPQRVGTQSFWEVPSTGVLQRSPAFLNERSRLQISAPENDRGIHFCVVLKLLLKPDQSLKVFIRNGEEADIRLPDDIYMLTFTWGNYWSTLDDRFEPLYQDKFSPSLLPHGMPAVLQIASLPNGEFHIQPAH